MRIASEDPEGEDLGLLFARHAQDMHSQTPAESVHMLPRSALRDAAIKFFVVRDTEGGPIGMAALKRISDGHGEIKSMHVLREARGQGVSRLLLGHLVEHARAQGMTRLSLETGVEPIFAPARILYSRAGFNECPPFGDYRPDPNSLFMTRII